MSKGNPMFVIKYSAKVEFQGRGAAHDHGTLWIDLNKMEFTFETDGESIDIDKFYECKNQLAQNEKHCLKEALRKCIENPDCSFTSDEEAAIRQFHFINFSLSNEINTTKEILNKLTPHFKMLGLKSAFYKFQINSDLTEQEEQAVTYFADKFTTCTLNSDSVGHDVVELVRELNCHRHTRSCRKYGCLCRFKFPRFPIWKTIIGKPSHLANLDDATVAKYKEILKDVREILDDDDFVHGIMEQFDKQNETKKEYEENREKRIKEILKKAGLTKEEDWQKYEDALRFFGSGYSVILAREMFVNNYNSEWVKAWRGNMDLQVCLDFFTVITYITEYYTKDDTSTMKFLMDALKGSEAEDLKDKMNVVMNTFITVRQMGEAEAYYRILPELHLKESNAAAVYVPNCRKAERSKFLRAVQNDEIHHNQVVVEVKDKPGKYVETYDVVDKWYRRPEPLQDLSFSYCAKMFKPAWTAKEDTETTENETEYDIKTDSGKKNVRTDENKFHFLMTSQVEETPRELPAYFKLTSVNPGEPPFMRKRLFQLYFDFTCIRKKIVIVYTITIFQNYCCFTHIVKSQISFLMMRWHVLSFTLKINRKLLQLKAKSWSTCKVLKKQGTLLNSHY